MHNCAFMHNCYSNRAYMHDYCSMCICYFINFRLHLFFSLFSVHNELSNFSSPHFLVPHMHTNTHTRKHIHTDKLTQRYTNAPTHTQINKETDWCLIGACGTIGARGYFSWTELDREGSCLIGAREIWPRGRVDLWSELRSLTEKGLAWGRVDRS